MTNNWSKLFEYNYNQDIIDINKYCDAIFYINLSRRTDRLQSIQTECAKYNIRATHFNAIDGNLLNYKIDSSISNGQIGCLSSHIEIIKICKDNKYKKIMILEDDVIFKNNIKHISHYINRLPVNWDMFYLTGNNLFGLKPINNLIYRTNGTLSTAAYMIRSSIFNQILDIANNTIEHPIDTYYAKMHQYINAYVGVPSLAYQMAGFSDIENTYVNYDFMK
jgi:GR25 family glycosyltransferase involved in LPS biosynthesis